MPTIKTEQLEALLPNWGNWQLLDDALLARVKEVSRRIDARLCNVMGHTGDLSPSSDQTDDPGAQI